MIKKGNYKQLKIEGELVQTKSNIDLFNKISIDFFAW